MVLFQIERKIRKWQKREVLFEVSLENCGMIVHGCSPSTQQAKQVLCWGLPGIHRETLSPKRVNISANVLCSQLCFWVYGLEFQRQENLKVTLQCYRLPLLEGLYLFCCCQSFLTMDFLMGCEHECTASVGQSCCSQVYWALTNSWKVNYGLNIFVLILGKNIKNDKIQLFVLFKVIIQINLLKENLKMIVKLIIFYMPF